METTSTITDLKGPVYDPYYTVTLKLASGTSPLHIRNHQICIDAMKQRGLAVEEELLDYGHFVNALSIARRAWHDGLPVKIKYINGDNVTQIELE